METDNPNGNKLPTEGTGWRSRVVIGGIALVALAGAGIAAAQSGDFGRGGGHFMHSSWGGRGFAERRLDYVLEAIKATPEQSEKIKTIVGNARDDMRATREGFVDARDRFADILGAATIDRAAAEKLRSERVQAIDEASKKLAAAMLDAAEVLTPEQRSELLQHFKERRAFGRW
jgi:Spy/CpxP family protein refolding chaperone